MLNAITLLLNFIQAQIANAKASEDIQPILDLLVAWVPFIIQSYDSLSPKLQEINDSLSAIGAATDDQKKILQAITDIIAAHFAAADSSAKASDALAKLINPEKS